METPIKPSAARNFDFFRISHGKDAVDVNPVKLREWAGRPNGPRIYRMNQDDMTWMRFSEVEAFIISNSTLQA